MMELVLAKETAHPLWLDVFGEEDCQEQRKPDGLFTRLARNPRCEGVPALLGQCIWASIPGASFTALHQTLFFKRSKFSVEGSTWQSNTYDTGGGPRPGRAARPPMRPSWPAPPPPCPRGGSTPSSAATGSCGLRIRPPQKGRPTPGQPWRKTGCWRSPRSSPR